MSNDSSKSTLLWEPSLGRINASEMTRFKKFLFEKTSLEFASYPELHTYSVEQSSDFWSHLSDFYGVVFNEKPTSICADSSFASYSWFEGAKLNFAENLLDKGEDEDCALHFIHESGDSERVSYKNLRKQTSSFAKALKGFMNKGDVLAAYMPNIPETVVSMLATSSFGGVFTSTSADFGIEGVVDRFGQSRPKVLVTVGSYQYNGKSYSLIPKLEEIEKRLDFIEKIVVVDFLNEQRDISTLKKGITWNDFIEGHEEVELSFTPVSFDHPLYIMYSSGTTGKPKCIVHSTGGTLIQHIKELGLHTDLTKEKSLLYFTTCGWMMWNWLVSGLYFGARVVLYEGSPGKPSLSDFFEIIDGAEINIFGTSPKFLRALEDSGYKNKSGLDSLDTILSTGAPLLPEQYDYIYSSLKKDVCVSSISGGTDIIGCFMLGNPTMPVKRGEIQCLGLGMNVACFDEEGNKVNGREGELVCLSSFPSRPLYFLNDDDGQRMQSAYFDHFPGVWHHGDFIEVTSAGGVIVYGRSDATLNPGGVRIGTAEIYRQTEKLAWLEDSVCVGKKLDGDVEVVLFVKCRDSYSLDEEKITEVKKSIKQGTTPRHVPRFVFQVSDIPYTRSGKKMELAVARIVEGRTLSNIEAVSNPECLEQYKSFF
jgi:acetoacetyl-CoA synthetase